jgi:hypothetical protein
MKEYKNTKSESDEGQILTRGIENPGKEEENLI